MVLVVDLAKFFRDVMFMAAAGSTKSSEAPISRHVNPCFIVKIQHSKRGCTESISKCACAFTYIPYEGPTQTVLGMFCQSVPLTLILS